MKKLWIILLLIPSLCFGASEIKTVSGVADSSIKTLDGQTTATVKTINGIDYNDGDSVADCSGASPSACTLRETFDGATACGDGSHSNCDNTWSYWNAWPDFNYATTPLQGTYSAMTNTSGSEIYVAFTSADTIYAAIIISDSALSHNHWFSVRDASDNILCKMWTYGYGADSIVVTNTGGTDRASDDHAFAVNTKYYMKVKAVKGTGSNARCEGFYSTDGTSWTSITASTDGTWTAQPAKIYIVGNDSITGKRDDVRIYTSDINY